MKNNKNKVCFAIAIFLWTSAQAINIDTRFESAVPSQQNQSFVFKDPQPFFRNDQTYGDVEFSNGIIFYPDIFNPDFNIATFVPVTLGVQPPIAGSLRMSFPVPSGGLTAQITTSHDLTLSITAFEKNQFIGFGGNVTFGFVINEEPHQIFLTRNIGILPDGMSLYFTSNANGILNGLDNTFAIPTSPDNSFLTLGALPPDGFTIKNITFLGAPGSTFRFDTVGLGLLTFENVKLAIAKDVNQFLHHSNLIYRGQGNVVGDGGFIQYASNPFQSLFVTLEFETRIHVLPNTTMALVKAPPAIGLGVDPQFYFNFTDKTSQLFLDNCTLQIGGVAGGGFPFSGGPLTTNLTFTKGTMLVNGNVKISSGAAGSSLQFGDGLDQANNFDVIILPGSKLIVEDGMTLINANV